MNMMSGLFGGNNYGNSLFGGNSFGSSFSGINPLDVMMNRNALTSSLLSGTVGNGVVNDNMRLSDEISSLRNYQNQQNQQLGQLMQFMQMMQMMKMLIMMMFLYRMFMDGNQQQGNSNQGSGIPNTGMPGFSSIPNNGSQNPNNYGVSNNQNYQNQPIITSKEGNGAQGTTIRDGKPIGKNIAPAYDEMLKAARKDGINLNINSGFRSRSEQADLYARYGPGRAAKPGTSNHEKGNAIDFANTPGAYSWLRSHASQYGFQNNISHEPWHYSLNGY